MQMIFRESIITGNQVSQVIGKWIGCLLFDHVSPVIGKQQFSFLSSSIHPQTYQNLTRRKNSVVLRGKEHVIFFSKRRAIFSSGPNFEKSVDPFDLRCIRL